MIHHCSVSGKEYKVSDRVIQKDDIITIDLGLQKNYIWGDYARTLVFEDDVLCDKIDRIKKMNGEMDSRWKNIFIKL